ncbi:hypothetical protein HDU80_000034 [Chytriomyces hyalinus]|nr:hypothetical protein HDU80_000034 [Chytriomyces hyalinus]
MYVPPHLRRRKQEEQQQQNQDQRSSLTKQQASTPEVNELGGKSSPRSHSKPTRSVDSLQQQSIHNRADPDPPSQQPRMRATNHPQMERVYPNQPHSNPNIRPSSVASSPASSPSQSPSLGRRTKNMAASVSDFPLATAAANGNTDLDSLTSNLNQLSISNSDGILQIAEPVSYSQTSQLITILFEPQDVVDLLADDALKSLCEGKWGSPEGDTSKTSILLVFAERSVAKRAFATLSCRRELKVRPCPGGVQSSDSQLQLESPSPSKRPLRTDAVARRLIAAALGLKLEKKSAEAIARDEEKKRLVREERVAQSRAAARREEEFQKAWDE